MNADRLPSPFRPEQEIVAECLARLEGSLDWSAVIAQARPWVEAVRRHPPPFWAVERLLQEYPLSSTEGLALMRLAEALLRVPDAPTALALTADQLGRIDPQAVRSGALGRLSSQVLGLSRQLLAGEDGSSGLVARLGTRVVVAGALRAVQLLAHQFVLGQDIAAASATAARQPGVRFSYDMLGEGARTAAGARRHFTHALEALDSLAARATRAHGPSGNDGLSIKLSALHPRHEAGQRERVLAELVPSVWSLCEVAARANVQLTIDAEESERLELSLDVFEALAQRTRASFPGWEGLGMALQAYQTRSIALCEHVIALARRLGVRFTCRLVKGAYWDAEIKRAQELGLPHYPVFTRKHHTDLAFLACARVLLDAPDAIRPQFATHNAGTLAALAQLAGDRDFELQRLHGMGEAVYRHALADLRMPCRVYAPVGPHRDLLAYLVRRLLENGANASFVHQLADPGVATDLLLASPLADARTSLETPGVPPAIPLPRDLLGGRLNSEGLDLAVAAMRHPLLAAHAALAVPPVPWTPPSEVPALATRAARAFPAWEATPITQRATALRRAADTMQSRLPALSALLVKEARKTWGDAVAEVREAVDFLRYYAGEAERVMAPVDLPGPTGEANSLRLAGRGPWVCISPWNFPLAIFTGQVAAALAAGNTVLAKPAEQTPAIAAEAVRILHASGIPAEALHLLHGAGETVGAALVAAPGVAGVAFTGSTDVARTIHRALAAREGPILPLVAETGGVNAMLVDSTALPEQVTDAVVQSAFRSAGQRCSALRLLCVHADIADDVIGMIAGAAAELSAGDPALLSTDVGPVIDQEAFATLQRHLARLRASARPVFTPEPHTGAPLHLVPPQAFEVATPEDVAQEVFGPVLHITRWSGDPRAVVDRLNARGWGLTLGLQTRIDSRALDLATRARVGNVYVNRNMIGAVVGVQPFGGEGLSGTGPKAGGPHYLPRFCVERTLCINTAAAGGNAALLAGTG